MKNADLFKDTFGTYATEIWSMPEKDFLKWLNEDAKPKTGHWIKSNIPNEKYVCSECGGGCWYYDYQANVAKSRYCPNCGAKMEVSDGTEI